MHMFRFDDFFKSVTFFIIHVKLFILLVFKFLLFPSCETVYTAVLARTPHVKKIMNLNGNILGKNEIHKNF